MLQPHIESGAIVAIGVVQEQHPARAALYKQWRRLRWPIFVDSLNLLGHKVVPIPMGINESGVVVYPRMRGERDLEIFLNKDFRPTEQAKTPVEPRMKGDAHFHAGELDAAIEAYCEEQGPQSPQAYFRLGVALRRRYESSARRPGDGQSAVIAWGEALALVPNQYIWRRRIQQYGPRLAKPYNFYSWVHRAREEIRARGEEPLPLRVEPRGAELLERGPVSTVALDEIDPEGKIVRDESNLVTLESIVTPAHVRPGGAVRVRLVFRTKTGLWNNEAGPLRLFAAGVAPLEVTEGEFTHSAVAEPETSEPRILEFEVVVAGDAKPGDHDVKGYALYYACEKKGGVCLYLRRDFKVTVYVDPQAPKIR